MTSLQGANLHPVLFYGNLNFTSSRNVCSYDANGNLTNDAKKGTTITYNEMNKPTIIVQNNTFDRVVFEYDAAGVRVSKTVIISGNSTTEYYIGGLVVQSNNTLKHFAMAEGRVRNNSGTLLYEYFITDQQGNTRVSFEDNGSGTAVARQENSYYPFGMPMASNYMPSDANKKLYNAGSEWQDEFSGIIDYYSTFFREYDPVIGRFNSVDPKAEITDELSIYHYSGNNPVNFNDPMGDWFTDGVAGFGANRNLGGHGYVWSNEDGYLFGGTNGEGPLYQLYQAIKRLIAQGNEITGINITQGSNGQWRANIGFTNHQKSAESMSAKHYYFSDPEFNYESKDMGNVIVGNKPVNLGYWKEGGNFVETLTTGLELGIGVAEFFGFREGEWWFSFKKFKYYNWSVPGNGFTGGKLKSSGAINSTLKWTGRVFSAANAYSVVSKMYNGNISIVTGSIELGVNGIETFSPYGWAVAIGWEGGRWLTSHTWYREFRADVQNAFGHPDEESRNILRTREILDAVVPDH